MFDAIYSKPLINVNLPARTINQNKSLVLSGCQVIMSEGVLPYSELDELSYYYLNNNDYNFGETKIELFFDNNFENPYLEFYIQCVSIRADNNTLCKINKNLSSKIMKKTYHTKIKRDGKVALGVGYFFRTEKEKSYLINCKSFLIEGFLALNKKSNVYGFMCCVEKTENGWSLREGNTYRIYNNNSIDDLYH